MDPGHQHLFSQVAEKYASHRPTYPQGFFSHLAARCADLALAWDCGCGNGQASVALADHFEQVIATDASAQQIQQARPHRRVTYRTASATASGLKDASVDAILVAQAVHWFAGEAFNAEVRRVAKPRAVMAWIGYLPLQVDDQHIQTLIQQFYGVTLKPWWSPQRVWVERSFAGLPFPGEEWPFPSDLWIERDWTLTQLLGYLSSWSAVAAAQRVGQDPMAHLQQELMRHWPAAGAQSLRVRWQFMGRWGQISHVTVAPRCLPCS
jgi:ubiquinone/menaquinone biosynthesis C-methylase UbiE